MALKITIFYNQGIAGFTETWYATGTEPPAFVATGVLAILKRAVAFRAPLTYVYAIRFSVVDEPRKTSLFKFSQVLKGDTGLPQATAPDVVSTTAQFRIRDANFNWRFLELRGLTDEAVIRDDATGLPIPQAGFMQKATAYLNMVYNAGWQMRVATKQTVGGLTQVPVITMQPNPANELQTDILVDSNLGLQVANFQKVRFYGVNKNDLPGFPTTTQIISKTLVAPWKIVIPYRMRQTAIYSPLKMRVIPAVYTYIPIADYSFWNFTKRDTGRPTGSLRGRARAVVRRV